MIERQTFLDFINLEHDLLSDLIINLNGSLALPKVFLSTFNDLKELSKNHFDFEEQEIYVEYPLDNFEDQLMIDRLKNEHKEILKRIDRLKKEFEKKNQLIFFPLQELLKKHNEFEKEYFYPRLNAHLAADKKKELLEKAKSRSLPAGRKNI